MKTNTPSAVKEEKVVPESPSDHQEVELDQDNKPVKPEPKPKSEPQYVTIEQLEKIQKGINYQNTSARKLEEKLERLLSQMQPPSQPSQPQSPPSEWDEKLNKDWKATVEELAELRFKNLMEKERQQQLIEAQETRRRENFEKSKRQVLERHPELADAMSEKALLYQQIVSENIDYTADPFGPVLAMHDMELKLREQGKLDTVTKKLVQTEVNRQARAGAGTVSQASSSPSTTKIVLSKDDLEFCKSNGIKPEDYARERKILDERRKGGA
jgi:hypothetical protein